MNNKTEHILSDAAKKIDLLLWIFSIPLLPMIIAEFSGALSQQTQIYFEAYYLILWLVFSVEFFLRIALARDKAKYLKEHWLDGLVVFTPAFGVFRVFRFMRLPVILLSEKLLSALGALSLNFLYYVIFVAVIVFLGADFIFFFEGGNPRAEIRSFSDAIWWAIHYMTTAGPTYNAVTPGGRITGVVLMTLGFAAFSILVASLVSFFMKEHSHGKKDGDLLEGIRDQLGIDEVMERLARIEKKLDRE